VDRARVLGVAFVVLVAIAISAAAALNDYQRVLTFLVVPLIAVLVFLIVTGNVQALALVVLPAAFLPLPALHIASAAFGPSIVVAPSLLLAGIVAASKEGLRIRLPYLWLYAAFILISIASVGFSWLAWDPAVGTGQAIGQGHRWLGYQLTQLYFLMLPFIAFASGAVYVQVKPARNVLGAIIVALVLDVVSSFPAIGATNPLGSLQLGQKAVGLNYVAAVLLAVCALSTLLWTEQRVQKWTGLAILLATLAAAFVSGYLNAIVALIPAIAILLWLRFVHRRVAVAVGMLVVAAGALQVVLASLKVFDLDRIQLWQDAMRVWSGSPLLGVGPGNLTGYMEAYSSFPRALVLLGYHQAHNTFLELLAEDGVLGLGAFTIFTTLLIRQLVRARGLTPTDHRLRASALGLLIASAVMAFVSSGFVPTVNSAGWSGVGIVTLVWLVAGLAVGRVRSYANPKVSTEEVPRSMTALAPRSGRLRTDWPKGKL
jgi:O-antigen ligase